MRFWNVNVCVACFFFSIPFVLHSPLFYLSLPSRNSDPGSPTTVRAFYFYREKTSALIFPRRLASNCEHEPHRKSRKTTRKTTRIKTSKLLTLSFFREAATAERCIYLEKNVSARPSQTPPFFDVAVRALPPHSGL